MVHTPAGSVRVPAAPKRIVAINPILMCTLYDLGISVTGVYDEGTEYVSPVTWRAPTRRSKSAPAGRLAWRKWPP